MRLRSFALLVLGILGSVGVRTSSWVHLLGFSAALALTIYATIEIEYPRLDFVQESRFDAMLSEVRDHMR